LTIAQGLLPFQLIEDSSKVLMTSFGGLPLVMEAFRALGLRQSIRKHLRLQQRSGKYEEADYVESFVSLFVAAGDCLDDFHLLRQDAALGKLGLKVPSPEAARFFLNAFHQEEALVGQIPHQAFIPEETQLLMGLGEVNRDLIRKATRREAPWKATVDIDATVMESDKREARVTYLGSRLLEVLQKAVGVLPPSVRLIRVRSDSAAYVHELLDWCREEKKARSSIEFAISADVSEELRAAIREVPEAAWKPLRKIKEKGLVVGRREWAEVEFVPSHPSRKKQMQPDRYLAIRIRPAQGQLFADGNAYHYFAVVTNMGWEGERLLRWQRERCGTVEQVIDVLKNDLAGGTLPCKRFFANATWFRLNVLAYNVLSVLKRQSLPSTWWTTRLKALRFHLLRLAARVVSHGRRIYLKVAAGHPRLPIYQEARKKLLLFSSA
jgi:hypothetical protein